jgi:hypothetical protein
VASTAATASVTAFSKAARLFTRDMAYTFSYET